MNDKKLKSNRLNIVRKPGEDDAVALTRTALRPTVQAAVTLRGYDTHLGDLDLSGLIESLNEQTQAVKDGDMKRGEEMLTAQAHTLDAIFNYLAQKAINAKYMDGLERGLKLALRAQSQCRATWEALAVIKNPPVMGYVKQANIAHGPQQVNNGIAPESETPRARENENPRNKLLEVKDGERLDTGATGSSGRTDQKVAAVGEIDGAKDC